MKGIGALLLNVHPPYILLPGHFKQSEQYQSQQLAQSPPVSPVLWQKLCSAASGPTAKQAVSQHAQGHAAAGMRYGGSRQPLASCRVEHLHALVHLAVRTAAAYTEQLTPQHSGATGRSWHSHRCLSHPGSLSAGTAPAQTPRLTAQVALTQDQVALQAASLLAHLGSRDSTVASCTRELVMPPMQ